MCIVVKKIVNHLTPFSVSIRPLIQDILDKEKIVEKIAGTATIEKINGLSSVKYCQGSVISDGTLEDSSRLQQVRVVIMEIKEEMKPLAKLEGTSGKVFGAVPFVCSSMPS